MWLTTRRASGRRIVRCSNSARSNSALPCRITTPSNGTSFSTRFREFRELKVPAIRCWNRAPTFTWLAGGSGEPQPSRFSGCRKRLKIGRLVGPEPDVHLKVNGKQKSETRKARFAFLAGEDRFSVFVTGEIGGCW